MHFAYNSTFEESTMQQRKHWPEGWTKSTYVCAHEYKHVSVDPNLAAEIEASLQSELYFGRVYRIIIREGMKYWITGWGDGAFINRKRIEVHHAMPSGQKVECK